MERGLDSYLELPGGNPHVLCLNPISPGMHLGKAFSTSAGWRVWERVESNASASEIFLWRKNNEYDTTERDAKLLVQDVTSRELGTIVPSPHSGVVTDGRPGKPSYRAHSHRAR